jgi:acyl-CoA dehydrogenase
VFGVRRSEEHEQLRQEVREACADFPDAYWRELDAKREYPEAFIEAMTKKGYLGAFIPEEYDGLGFSLTETTIILEEINRSGGNAQPAHAQVYVMGTLLRHGSEEQKREYLPKIASGELRLQAFGVTEPEAGTDTTSLRTTAVRDEDHYVINGRKIYISRIKHSDLMVLLARTTPLDEVRRRSEGLSVFLIDLRKAVGNGLTVNPPAGDDQQPDQRARPRKPARPSERPDRRRREGFPLHNRRDERRADPDLGRVRR